MSTNNGRTLESLRQRRQTARLRRDVARLEAEAGLLESSFGTGEAVPGFPSSWYDPFDLYRGWGFGPSWVWGAGNRGARKDGADRPFFWNEVDLERSRGLARWLATRNEFAVGIMEALTDYVVKTGYTVEVQPKKRFSKDVLVAELAEQVQEAIDEFGEANDLPDVERESFLNSRVDGEDVQRVFDVGPDLPAALRPILPEQLRQPPGTDANYTYGRLTAPGDVLTCLEYAVDYSGESDFEYVPADQISYLKMNTPRVVKRGLSDFYCCESAFDETTKLLRSMRITAGVRESVAWFEQFPQAAATALAAKAAGMKDINRPQVTDPITGRVRDYRRLEPGQMVMANGDRVREGVPNSSTPASLTVLEACYRAMAVRWRAPEFLMAADASNNNYACHDEQTEALTERGWLSYADIRPDDRLATMNPQTGRLEFQQGEMHVYRHAGPMIRLSGAHNLDVLVTPNHRLWVTREVHARVEGVMRHTGKLHPFRFIEAGEALASRTPWVMPFAVAGFDGDVPASFTLPGLDTRPNGMNDHIRADRVLQMLPWLRFLGYWLSEGWVVKDGPKYLYTVGLSQRPGAVADAIRSTLLELPSLKFHEYRRSDGMVEWKCGDSGLHHWISTNCGVGALAKHVPDFVNRLDGTLCYDLLSAMVAGDGSTHKSGSMTYFTVSRQLADDVCALGVKAGCVAGVKRQMRNGVWPVALRVPRPCKVWPRQVSQVHYDGAVWCATVPNGLLLTRRNGKVAITGNSILIAGAPFVNAGECAQAKCKKHFLDWRWKAVRVAAKYRRFIVADHVYTFAEIKRLLDIHATPPQIAISNKAEELQQDDTDLKNGVQSIQGIQAKRGYDSDKVAQDRKEMPPPGSRPPGGEGGAPGAGPGTEEGGGGAGLIPFRRQGKLFYRHRPA